MAGEELLIADSVDRDGLRKLFEDAGYVCSTPVELERTRVLQGNAGVTHLHYRLKR